ncbi:NADH-quinone oxidoreductase subunit M [Candidatus Westeberhardia cardiocondylae]|uniref:NADH-quinone oxidoreductase subunit M n=1 Tax=Candidatus Westeberhardia cardiocondylae TaxID=1594731 RepID=A0A0H5BXA1_9ENTR|nr:NADH-quinone oxidoreductase subunit M [Candidatus Westeberhardia cardiocondylae]CEN32329.1 NADH-quinone oxidoreductase subunit M [Candidatus Westeberhardia cardiocondylae]
MLLPYLILIPFTGGILSWQLEKFTSNTKIIKWISLISTVMTFVLSIIVWVQGEQTYQISNKTYPKWKLEYVYPWISDLGINIHFAIDGLSGLMIILSGLLGMASILCSWSEINYKPGTFYFHLLWIIGSVIGIFLSINMFIFFIFWEIILIPTYFLIILWGCPTYNIYARIISAKKLLLYFQISGLIMLMAILNLASIHYYNNGFWTFEYEDLLQTKTTKTLEYLNMLSFFLAFTIKIPIIPIHGWAATVHKQSPTANSIELTSLLLKTGVYGLLRFNLTLFPQASNHFSYAAVLIGMTSMFYGAWMAYSQMNMKTFIAYTNISHMGLIIIAIYSNSLIAYQGAIIYMIANTLSSSGMFIICGQLYERLRTHNMRIMGGLWDKLNTIPKISLFFFAATFSIPGTGNFIGEIIILFGTFQNMPIITIIISFWLIFSAIYSLKKMQQVYYGKNKIKNPLKKVTKREKFIIYLITYSIIFIGLFPKSIINIYFNTINNIHHYIITHKH